MNKLIEKYGTVMLSGAMLFSATGVMINQTAFAGQLDKTIEVTPIKQLPHWCWIYSGQMVLRKYLEDNGKLSKGESIYEKYGDECLKEVCEKSKEEFEQLYKRVFIDKSLPIGYDLGSSLTKEDKEDADKLQNAVDNLKDNLADKDAAFLVYLSTDILNKNNYNEIFQKNKVRRAAKAVDIVLEAAGLNNKKCFKIENYSEAQNGQIDWKFGVINYALSKNSSVGSMSDGHVEVINGIKDNKISVQETNGAPAKWVDADSYLKDKVGFIFIDDDVKIEDNERLKGIWSINPNKNQDDVIYKKDEEISILLHNNDDKINLINRDKKIEFIKTKYILWADFRYWSSELYKYEAKAIEDVTLKDLIDNYHFDEGEK